MKNIDIDEMFFPSQHITDPKWFAGRKNDIENALTALCTKGSSLAIFGERGAGKTSFIEMIKLLAKGKSDLLYKHNFQKRFPPHKFKYKVVSFMCNSETDTTAKVLQNIITNPHGLKSFDIAKQEHFETVIKEKFGIDFKLFKFGSESETKETFANHREDSIYEIFSNIISTITKDILDADEGLLIVIDEFDLVKDKAKMASLIKTLSVNNTKFLLCGIGDSYKSLIDGHESVIRQFMYGRININLMTKDEVCEVFNLIEDNCKKQIRFDDAFKALAYEKSNGFPYYVQLFGKLAVEEYIKEKGYQTPITIHNKYLVTGIKKLSFYEIEMEEDYLKIIGENQLKELMIKFLAKQTSKKINEADIFKYCFDNDIRQPLPKNTLASLLGNRDPQFIVRESERSEYIVFINPLFKTFINSRESEL